MTTTMFSKEDMLNAVLLKCSSVEEARSLLPNEARLTATTTLGDVKRQVINNFEPKVVNDRITRFMNSPPGTRVTEDEFIARAMTYATEKRLWTASNTLIVLDPELTRTVNCIGMRCFDVKDFGVAFRAAVVQFLHYTASNVSDKTKKKIEKLRQRKDEIIGRVLIPVVDSIDALLFDKQSSNDVVKIGNDEQGRLAMSLQTRAIDGRYPYCENPIVYGVLAPSIVALSNRSASIEWATKTLPMPRSPSQPDVPLPPKCSGLVAPSSVVFKSPAAFTSAQICDAVNAAISAPGRFTQFPIELSSIDLVGALYSGGGGGVVVSSKMWTETVTQIDAVLCEQTASTSSQWDYKFVNGKFVLSKK